MKLFYLDNEYRYFVILAPDLDGAKILMKEKHGIVFDPIQEDDEHSLAYHELREVFDNSKCSPDCEVTFVIDSLAKESK